ncbi:MFS transporter, partial [Acinetobacter baumannii]|uniref:MFS transporter n=1 Tax=Acinetobacter baumannii TaxID=470 RepID=UPI001146D036
FLTFSPSLIFLHVGRIIAVITSANMPVASTSLVDVSQGNSRAEYVGLITAMFGSCIIIGPVLGGFWSEYGLRLPFIVAALLTGLHLLFAYF